MEGLCENIIGYVMMNDEKIKDSDYSKWGG